MPRDLNKAPDILQKIAKRAGKSFSPEQLASHMASSVTSSLQNPLVKSSPQIYMPDTRLGLAKIAYELAWWWLGEEWLLDPRRRKNARVSIRFGAE